MREKKKNPRKKEGNEIKKELNINVKRGGVVLSAEKVFSTSEKRLFNGLSVEVKTVKKCERSIKISI